MTLNSLSGKTEWSRRDAIRAAAGATALSALAAPASATNTTTAPTSADIAIVGAGFAGLTAARALTKLGRSVIVLEADNRVGGRTKAATLAGETVDVGGQWVGPTQTSLIALAKDYGVESVEQFAGGDNIIEIEGRKARYRGESPELAPADLEQFGALVAKIDAMAATITMPRPWEAKGAADWDSETLESWLRRETQKEPVRILFRALARSVFSAEAHEISFLYFLAYAAAAGGVEALIATRGGAQDRLFVGGVWQIAHKIASELGARVVLDAPVTRIRQDADGVLVETPLGDWRARYAIVTAPPAMASRIRYDPPMPARRDGLSQRMPLGCVIKVVIAYDRPFWRDQGLSGLVLSDRTEFGPWFDRATPRTNGGALVGFFDGAPARRWADRSAPERRAKVLDDIAFYLGEAARHPTDYVEEVWTDSEWHRGGYVSAPGPGVLTAFGPALLDPVGRIHWAGTETSDVWLGYIDGAIRSGDRAAREVNACFRPS